MMMKKVILSLVMVAALFSCEESVDPIDNDTVLMAQGSLHGAGDEGISEQNTVITNEADWNNLLSQMNSVNDESSNFVESDIDFSTHRAVAVFDEVRPSGGFGVELNVVTTDDKVMIEVIKGSPDGAAITVITQPYIIVKLPKSGLPIEFQ